MLKKTKFAFIKISQREYTFIWLKINFVIQFSTPQDALNNREKLNNK